MTQAYDRNLWIICQTFLDRPLTKAIDTKTRVHMMSVTQKLLFGRLIFSVTNAHDAVANNVMYHGIGWVKAKRDAEPKTTAIEN